MTQPAEAPATPPPQTIAQQPTLYDSQGQPVDMNAGEAHAAIVSGQAGFLKTDKVHLVTDKGVRLFSGADVPKMLRAGAKLASDDEIHHAKVEAKYGSGAGQVMTSVLGGLSGATLGLSDIAANALGGEHYVEEHREANPLNFAISQGVGAIAPMFIPGADAAAAGEIGEATEGASALSKAAEATRAVSAPTRAVGRAGSAVESVVRHALGAEGESSLVAGLAKKALAKGAGAATEGALLGVAQELDEHEITGNPEVNGEKVLAAMGHGALLGLATGAGLTAAGEIGSRVLGKVAPSLGKMAETEAFRSINARKAFTNEADKIPGGVEGVGREMLEKGTIGFGDTVETIAPKVAKAKEEAGAKIGAILDAADEAGYEGPRVNDVRARIQKDVLPELEKLEGTNAGAIGKVKTLLADLDNFAGIPKEEEIHSIADANRYAEAMQNARLTFRQAQEFRSRLDDTIRWATNPLAPVNEATEAMKKIRGVLETELEESGERAANKLGGTFKDEYRAAKLSYRRLTVADKAAQDAVSRSEANRRISLTDYLGGDIASHALHAIGGGVVGGAAGVEEGGGSTESTLGGFAAGAIGALAHHAIRTRGNAAAAVLLDKLASLRGIERAVQHVDTQIERGVGGFFKEEGRVPVKLREPIEAAKGEHVAETAHAAVMRAAANDNAHIADIAKAAKPIDAHAPQTSNSFQRAALRATSYLASVAPRPQVRPSLTPQFDKPMLTGAQKADYARVVAAVHDPATVLRDMQDGRVTRSQVDAIRIVYPALFADIEQRIHERLASLKEPLTSAQKTQLATVLGIAPDATYEAGFIVSMQQSYGPTPTPQGGGKGKGGGTVKRPLKDNLANDVSLALNGKHGGA